MPADEPIPGIDDEDYWRQCLVDHRQELQALIEAHDQDSKPVELDQTKVGRLSRMDALQVQAMAQATSQRRQTALQRLDQALHRVDAGEFGYCLNCSEPIHVKRLSIDPATPLCLKCADRPR